MAARHRYRCRLRDHHRLGSGRECHSDEDVSAGEVDAHCAQPVSVQPGSGGPVAAGDLRPRGRKPLPGGRVVVRARRLQVDPLHPAHLSGGLRVHPDCALC